MSLFLRLVELIVCSVAVKSQRLDKNQEAVFLCIPLTHCECCVCSIMEQLLSCSHHKEIYKSAGHCVILGQMNASHT